ncbi:MAG: hypothetical protein ACRDSI_06025 [Pseudonocardiaceae bacterium]
MTGRPVEKMPEPVDPQPVEQPPVDPEPVDPEQPVKQQLVKPPPAVEGPERDASVRRPRLG